LLEHRTEIKLGKQVVGGITQGYNVSKC